MPLLQIAENEPDPAGGYYERIPGTNKINGKFWEYAEWKPNRILVNQVSDEDAIKALKGLADEAARLGIKGRSKMNKGALKAAVRRKQDKLPVMEPRL